MGNFQILWIARLFPTFGTNFLSLPCLKDIFLKFPYKLTPLKMLKKKKKSEKKLKKKQIQFSKYWGRVEWVCEAGDAMETSSISLGLSTFLMDPLTVISL